MGKLHILLIFSKLVVFKLLTTIALHMHNFIVKFAQILEIYKNFAGNRVDKNGNRPHRGVIPKFSDLEVIALSTTAEAFGFDSENYLFKRLNAHKGESLPNLISRRQYNERRKLTAPLGEEIRKDIAMAMDGNEDVFSIDSKPVKVCQNARANRCAMGRDDYQRAPQWGYCASQGIHYYGYKLHAICGISGVIHSYDMTAANVHDLHYLNDVQWEYHDCMMLGDKGYLSAEVQQNLFDVANITLEVPYRLNQKNWRPPTWAYKKFRKRIETLFSQLNDQFMMIRNYAKQPTGLFTRTAAKIAAMTVLQYVNFVNHREIGQVKYALI
ncbi:IS982 family transposase [Parabacteroides distasonis]|uniref:IS982 family transposase n=1 Tax=Parabacteroides distasonis TaxID=823 RepID=UPI002804E182|nr:IS982 family transposase [Parabacteroides distasonis]WMI41425.1 IS982 family transposase [Parabacteroides distasonis]WMI41479.1 IS982 family transposase [Parabacteroides distasonis]WMI41498.1 IS982 family transposase [Parabacteroides distasonis]WMI41540.1 IS982 family transposase [Parabacteroides distasonis]WMI41649.1 IS982 family transposase [Parabacteroides distasonis]